MWACSKYVHRFKNLFGLTRHSFWGLVIRSWEQWCASSTWQKTFFQSYVDILAFAFFFSFPSLWVSSYLLFMHEKLTYSHPFVGIAFSSVCHNWISIGPNAGQGTWWLLSTPSSPLADAKGHSYYTSLVNIWWILFSIWDRKERSRQKAISFHV